jgi:hypothetical protein
MAPQFQYELHYIVITTYSSVKNQRKFTIYGSSASVISQQCMQPADQKNVDPTDFIMPVNG